MWVFLLKNCTLVQIVGNGTWILPFHETLYLYSTSFQREISYLYKLRFVYKISLFEQLFCQLSHCLSCFSCQIAKHVMAVASQLLRGCVVFLVSNYSKLNSFGFIRSHKLIYYMIYTILYIQSLPIVKI